jgi:hypothetical protein
VLAAGASAFALVGLGAIVVGATAAGGPQAERVSTDDSTTTTASHAAKTTTTSVALPTLTAPTTSPPVTVPPGSRSTLPSTSTTTTTHPVTPNSQPPTDTIQGTLVDGRPWSLRDDKAHGLCLVLGDTDFGCDDEGPVLDPGSDPATPRIAVEGHGFPRDQLGLLVYAYLPAGATEVVLLWDGGRASSHGLVIDPAARFYGIPVAQGDNADRVSYRDDQGNEVRRFTLPGHG